MADVGGIIVKGRQIIIPKKLQKEAVDQLHSNHMGIEKMTLLT